MAKKAWAAFAHPSKAFEYDGAKLARAWPVLHAGDLEPFPDEKRVAAQAYEEALVARGWQIPGLAIGPMARASRW